MKRMSKSACFALLAAALLGGALFRVWHVRDRGFWRDEAWVADTVLHNGFAHLLTQGDVPLPPLFAVVTKALGSAVGPPELGLRLLPLFCGLAVPALAYLAARSALAPRTVAATAAILCAFSLSLVIWSRELKQYEVEAFFSTLAAWLTFGLGSWTGTRRTVGAVGLGFVCVTAPWLGYSCVFALTALLVGLAVMPGRGRRARVVCALCVAAAMALSAAAAFHVAASAQANHPALAQFWQNSHVDLTSPRSLARAVFMAAFGTTHMLVPPIWFVSFDSLIVVFAAAPIWALAGIGLWRWPRRYRVPAACFVIGPWLLMIAAAFGHHYPFTMQRLLVFTAPALLIAVGAGLVVASRACVGVLTERRGAGMVSAAVIAFLPALYVWQVAWQGRYWSHDDYPRLLSTLEQQRRPGEPVWVTEKSAPPVRYYAGNKLQPALVYPTVAGSLPDPEFDQRQAMKRIFSGPGRYWIITTANPEEQTTELFRWLRTQGFKSDLVGEFGSRHWWEAPQLYRLTRN